MILAGFAGIVGVLTTNEVRNQFESQTAANAQHLQNALKGRLGIDPATGEPVCGDYATAEAQIRIYDLGDGQLVCDQDSDVDDPAHAGQKPQGPTFPPPTGPRTVNELGYRVVIRTLSAKPIGQFALLYARPYSDIDHELGKIRIS